MRRQYFPVLLHRGTKRARTAFRVDRDISSRFGCRLNNAVSDRRAEGMMLGRHSRENALDSCGNSKSNGGDPILVEDDFA
jgi:hypothetical protein